MRPYRIGTSSATRVRACSSSKPTGSGRSTAGSQSPCAERRTVARAAFPRAARSVGVGGIPTLSSLGGPPRGPGESGPRISPRRGASARRRRRTPRRAARRRASGDTPQGRARRRRGLRPGHGSSRPARRGRPARGSRVGTARGTPARARCATLADAEAVVLAVLDVPELGRRRELLVVGIGDAGFGQRALEDAARWPRRTRGHAPRVAGDVDEQPDVGLAQGVEEALERPAVDADRHDRAHASAFTQNRAPGRSARFCS